MIVMKQNDNNDLGLDQVGDNYCGKYLVITMKMMQLRRVKKEPISMTMNQGRSGREEGGVNICPLLLIMIKIILKWSKIV